MLKVEMQPLPVLSQHSYRRSSFIFPPFFLIQSALVGDLTVLYLCYNQGIIIMEAKMTRNQCGASYFSHSDVSRLDNARIRLAYLHLS